MLSQRHPLSVVLFLIIVGLVLFVSFYTARRARSASGYYAAGGRIHWGVNGIAFAGDYLSAASFLGICGLIAVSGFDGFLYSIGYLAGWVLALFVVAEPLRRLGRYTFTDALDAKFNKRNLKLMAAISTLIISLFYLIPQMVGAGVLITPLLGFPHWVGVVIVGAIVIGIVATAGMTSTTYVQFIKGSLLVAFSLIIVVALLVRGFSTNPNNGTGTANYTYKTIEATVSGDQVVPKDASYKAVATKTVKNVEFVKLERNGTATWWHATKSGNGLVLHEGQEVVTTAEGKKLVNGGPVSKTNDLRLVSTLAAIDGQTGNVKTGALDPISFLSKLGDPQTVVNRWSSATFTEGTSKVQAFYSVPTPGNTIVKPGLYYHLKGSVVDRVDFVSLMIALFLGTAALPHILIRYYTVPSQAAARKSTVVGISAIGFFYILTLFLGLGAMTNGTVNLLDNNMSAPLLARSFGTFLFSMISAIAFATVLGTVAGLIVASSGAVAHDLMDRFAGRIKNDKQKVIAGRLAAVGIGALAIVLGILFRGVNVSFLVGLAFATAAAANLPSIIAMLFWKRTTSWGMAASIGIGIVASIVIICLSPTAYELYGLDPATAPIPFKNPGIFSIPLSAITLYLVSRFTKPDMVQEVAAEPGAPEPVIGEALLVAEAVPVRSSK
jgi:cation/acetate symporter